MIASLVVALCAGAAGAEDFSLQGAINEAADGDVIRVPPGVYRERVDFKGKSLRIIAWDPERGSPGNPEDHIIEAPADAGPAVSMSSAVLPADNNRTEMVLEGFAVRGGSAVQGGGIYIGGWVFVELYRCLLTDNEATDPAGENPGAVGGGVYVDGTAYLTAISCGFVQNRADSTGSALYVASGPVGAADRGRISLINCTISANSSEGHAVVLAGLRGETCLYNNIIWGNEGGDLLSDQEIVGHCNDIGVASGVVCAHGCLSIDPAFSDVALGNFRLRRDSPLRDRACDPADCLFRPFGRPPQYTDIHGNVPEDDRDLGMDEYFEIFVRADVNQNTDPGEIGDAISILSYLFSGAPNSCDDAGDANDDGRQDLSDAIYVLIYYFRQGPPPPPPFPPEPPGRDPTPDDLDCELYDPHP